MTPVGMVPGLVAALTSEPEARYAGRRYDPADLIAQADRPPPWRVVDLAMDAHLTILAAEGGEGKTWLGMALAGGVAHGATVAGLECEQGRALLLDAESGGYVLGSRLRAIDPALPADRVAVYDAAGLRLEREDDEAWMLDVIRAEAANLVVLDSLRTLTEAAESDSDEMAPVVIAARRLARESGAAVVLLAHRGWAGTRPLRGSSAQRDMCDLLFTLGRERDDPESRWRRRLGTAKCRVAEEPEDRWIGIRGWRGQVQLTEAEAYEPAGRPAGKRDERAGQVLDVLRGAEGPLSRGAIARELGRPEKDSTTRRATDRLVEDGRVLVVEGGYALATGGCHEPDDTPDTPDTEHRASGGSPWGPHPPKGGGPGDTPRVLTPSGCHHPDDTPDTERPSSPRPSEVGAYGGADDPQVGGSVDPDAFADVLPAERADHPEADGP